MRIVRKGSSPLFVNMGLVVRQARAVIYGLLIEVLYFKEKEWSGNVAIPSFYDTSFLYAIGIVTLLRGIDRHRFKSKNYSKF